MARLLVLLLLASLAVGCGKRPAAAPAPDTKGEEPAVLEPPDPKVIKLPTAVGAKPIVLTDPKDPNKDPGLGASDSGFDDFDTDELVFLNVNYKGQVLLAPSDQYRIPAQGANPPKKKPRAKTPMEPNGQDKIPEQKGTGPELLPAPPPGVRDEEPPPPKDERPIPKKKKGPPPKDEQPVEPVEDEGTLVTTLDNLEQIENFLKRRAMIERRKRFGDPNPLRSVIILRVDAQTPFEKTYGIMKAAQSAGFTRFRWRAIRSDKTEGQFAAVAPPVPDGGPVIPDLIEDRPASYVARVTADDEGGIATITLGGIDLKGDVDVLLKRCKDLKAKHKDKRVVLNLLIDGKLLHADVINSIDACVRAGFPDVWPVPLDLKKR